MSDQTRKVNGEHRSEIQNPGVGKMGEVGTTPFAQGLSSPNGQTVKERVQFYFTMRKVARVDFYALKNLFPSSFFGISLSAVG